MATQNLIQPVYAGSTINESPRFAGGPEEPLFEEAASQTFGVGDLIYIDSSGEIAICTATSTKLNSAIAGQATKKASGTTGEDVHFRVIRPDDLFIMNVYHATAASAVTTDDMLGDVYGIITPSASGKSHVDIENTAEDGSTKLGKVKVVGFPGKHPDGTTNTIGDIYGLVLVKFEAMSLETDSTTWIRNLQLA